MAQPALRLSLRSPCASSMPRLLQPFVHPKTFCPQGSANLYHLSRQEKTFPTAWAPPAGVTAQVSPTGLQTAPCGCCVNPQVFYIQRTSTNLPPPATTTLNHGAASLQGAAMWGPRGRRAPPAWAAPGTPQSQPQYFAPFNLQGKAVVPAPPVLPPCFPGYQDMERQFAQLSLSNTVTPTGAAMGSNIAPGSNVLSHCADPHIQAVGDPAGDLPLPKETLLDCSLVSQDGPSSVPMLKYPGGTSRAISYYDIGSLSLPAELLTADYSIPETSDAVLSLEQFNTIRMEPQEPWGHVGTDSPLPQPGSLEKRGEKRKSTFPSPPSKRRALAVHTRVGKWY